MMSIMFSAIMLSLVLTMINIMTPLAMGFWIIMTALMASLVTGLLFYSWFGFMIFLIYIGGMLVMFAYFLAIIPNQELKMKIPMIMLSLLTTLMLMLGLTKPVLSHSLITPQWITALISYDLIPMMTLLGLVLFLALLMVVKISSFFSGPLRPYN